ncbi:bifunctional N(6)-L-threonylcarbamoyladenine synthase/serine/threonine protein kinase [Halobacterium sp. R2-5]|uniref:bifunctional N(6)-L-threonylcarbamoyladenine synthase/serine/threonine protein kinase n=1 Tax=Halobacterium sp. R2-5 TaxID=2715751 RepID=UPI00141F4A57|nr:bifunctional N(6)-L-threonylcarbamoyladenine synthase/serine/threonine protein kinase [Halobacterium sp. R2-5]NIB99769.1 bifunctional N(6)-L-threonylcarbamoyladenine synthase/serine/threonine protein kinase [Halobacterium sp. R2-5]
MRVLGIEGTAWCASAALYDSGTDSVVIESDAYAPDSGGIHPREAAEHMRSAIPEVVETILDESDGQVDAVAFSRGPGLGPCLRIVGSAARALAQTLDVPLVGVNHMVAHLEIGRHRSGFDAPVCLNASGANAHVLAFRNGRYRVLGETMDTGVGNALDKFTRHVGWSHPGGPKVESHAKDGEYTDLPYVVKGMDFSFSGIMSAAKQAYDDGTPVEDVCRGLEETVFAMLAEVSERALSLTGRDELVLGGGVAQNDRLRGMLAEMCEQRGADFFAPEPRFLRDNAGMIAVLGEKMARAGDTLEIEDSAIDSNFRPDEVPVTWRDPEPPVRPDRDVLQGAEATVTFENDHVTKVRLPKSYRHGRLDARLRRDRTVLEARLTSEARRHGVPTPLVWDVDVPESTLTLQRVGDSDLRDALTESRVRDVGRHLAAIHDAGFVHGDPTTRNVRVTAEQSRDEPAGSETTRERVSASDDRTFLIDFGLGYYTDDVEDYAMDCHVFEQSLAGTADDAEALTAAFEDAYGEAGDEAVLDQLRAIEGRGRYQ